MYLVINSNGNGVAVEHVDEDTLIQRLAPEEDYYALAEGREIHTAVPLGLSSSGWPDAWPDGLWILEVTALVPVTDPNTGLIAMMTDEEREFHRSFTLEGQLEHACLTAQKCSGTPREKLEAAARELVCEGHAQYGNGIGERKIGDESVLYIKPTTPDMPTLISENGSIRIDSVREWIDWTTERAERIPGTVYANG